MIPTIRPTTHKPIPRRSPAQTVHGHAVAATSAEHGGGRPTRRRLSPDVSLLTSLRTCPLTTLRTFKIADEDEISQRFSIAEADQSLRTASWLRDFASLSKKDRRQRYNNLFENYFAEKKKRQRN
jgi:hypothetical protein